MNKLFQGRLWRAMEFLGNAFLVNTMWLVGCLPIFTIGASTSAMCHTYFRLFTGRQEPLFKLFKDGFKSNFKQATKVWLVYLFLIVDALIVLWTIKSGTEIPAFLNNKFTICVAVLVSLVAVLTINYIFGIMAYFDCSTLQCFVNALGISFRYVGRSIMMLVFSAICAAVAYIAPFMTLVVFGLCGAAQCRVMLKLFERTDAQLHLPEEMEEDPAQIEAFPEIAEDEQNDN